MDIKISEQDASRAIRMHKAHVLLEQAQRLFSQATAEIYSGDFTDDFRKSIRENSWVLISFTSRAQGEIAEFESQTRHAAFLAAKAAQSES